MKDFEINHPQTCIVIQDLDHTMTYAHGDGNLAVFSNEENSKVFVIEKDLGVVALRAYSWDELVDDYGDNFEVCTIDHTGKSGFYSTAPLIKRN